MNDPTFPIILVTSFTIGLTGAIMPGPLLAYTLRESVRHGLLTGFMVTLGHGILEVGLVIALVLGLSRIVGNEVVVSIVGIVGGMILAWMGYSTIQHGRHQTELPSAAKTEPSKRLTAVISSMVISASNPYFILWWATIGVTYLLWSLKLGAGGVSAFYASHLSADMLWYVFIAFVVVRGKRLLNITVYRWFMIICGLALIGMGLYFVVSGFSFLSVKF